MKLTYLGKIEGQDLHTDSHSLYIGDMNTPDYTSLLISAIPGIVEVVELEDERRLYKLAYNTYEAYEYLLNASLNNLDCKQICNDYEDPYQFFYETLGRVSGNDGINKAVATALVDSGNERLKVAYDNIYPGSYQ
jgi:hypothetical protein